jgi:hypothetical protein
VHTIARSIQEEEETYISESQAFVEQQSRDAALAAQAEAAARTLMLQQVQVAASTQFMQLHSSVTFINNNVCAGGRGAGSFND